MKTMTCRQLAGACDQKFQAETFEEMGEMSKKHAMEMAQKGDKPHLDKMVAMKNLMQDPVAMKQCFDQMRQDFEALPKDN